MFVNLNILRDYESIFLNSSSCFNLYFHFGFYTTYNLFYLYAFYNVVINET